MPVSKEHYLLVRRHFFYLLGGQCECGFNEFEKIHFHHKTGAHLMNGESNTGRGRDTRLWNLFTAYFNQDLKLVCPECHKKCPIEKFDENGFRGI